MELKKEVSFVIQYKCLDLSMMTDLANFTIVFHNIKRVLFDLDKVFSLKK